MSGKHELALLGGEPIGRTAPEEPWPPLDERDARQVSEMVLRGELSYYGREGQTRELEDKFADYLGVRHCLATSSGTTALHSAYFALGLEPGDEVLAPTFTFLATVLPLLVANLVPVLVDADPVSGNLDLTDLEQRITPRTRAIVVTHLWGNPVDMDQLVGIARRRGLKIVEDCSHAHGAQWGDRKVGTFGDVNVFSLQGKKLVAAGQGGMLVTDNQEMFERAVLLGHFKVRAFDDVQSAEYRPYADTGFGLNYRMHPLAAAIANRQMDHLEEYIQGRRSNHEYLSALLAEIPGIDAPAIPDPPGRHVYYGYKPSYRADQLDGLPMEVYLAAVRAEGVPLSAYGANPLHLEPLFQRETTPLRTHGVPETLARPTTRRRYRTGDLPKSERHAASLLTLPAYTRPVRAELESYAAALTKVASELDALHDYANCRTTAFT